MGAAQAKRLRMSLAWYIAIRRGAQEGEKAEGTRARDLNGVSACLERTKFDPSCRFLPDRANKAPCSSDGDSTASRSGYRSQFEQSAHRHRHRVQMLHLHVTPSKTARFLLSAILVASCARPVGRETSVGGAATPGAVARVAHRTVFTDTSLFRQLCTESDSGGTPSTGRCTPRDQSAAFRKP
jgi:hypothetical protein